MLYIWFIRAGADDEPETLAFRDEHFELFIWRGNERLQGFELHYRTSSGLVRSVRWTVLDGYAFEEVQAYVLVPVTDENVPLDALRNEFAIRSRVLDEDVRAFVLSHLQEPTKWHSGDPFDARRGLRESMPPVNTRGEDQ
jgi:hypothetical protein